MRCLALAIALLAAPAAVAQAQSSMSPREIHDRVVAVIRRRATSPLPSGDTSVTWYRGPILYHIVYAGPKGVRSGFLRNDTLVGKAEVSWADDGPTGFDVAWLAAGAVVVHVTGQRHDSTLTVSGSRHESWPVPTIPWTVEDLGLEEHLAPLILRLPPSKEPQRVAVYRPFHGRWDTLSVVVTRGANESYRVRQWFGTDTVSILLDAVGRLLQVTSSDLTVERRPLEESALFPDYERLRAAPRE